MAEALEAIPSRMQSGHAPHQYFERSVRIHTLNIADPDDRRECVCTTNGSAYVPLASVIHTLNIPTHTPSPWKGSPAHANRFTNQFPKKLPSRKIIRTSAHLQICTLNIHLPRPCAFLSAKGLVGCRGRGALRTPIDLPINSKRNSRPVNQSAHPHIRTSAHLQIRKSEHSQTTSQLLNTFAPKRKNPHDPHLPDRRNRTKPQWICRHSKTNRRWRSTRSGRKTFWNYPQGNGRRKND